MAFCELKYMSRTIGLQTTATVLLPEDPAQEGPFPVLYLLHGLSDDHTTWHRRTSIERYVDGLPLIVVMPTTARGFYIDAVEGPAYGAAFMQDLVPLIDRTFHTRADRSGRCLAGLSMGGYGAVRLACGNPNAFCAAASHSGALAFGSGPFRAEGAEGAEFRRILGDHPETGPNNLFSLVEALPPAERPALWIDCGVDDFLIEPNRYFHQHLGRIGYAHEYVEYPGVHDWEYWDRHIQDSLRFLCRAVGVRRPA